MLSFSHLSEGEIEASVSKPLAQVHSYSALELPHPRDAAQPRPLTHKGAMPAGAKALLYASACRPGVREELGFVGTAGASWPQSSIPLPKTPSKPGQPRQRKAWPVSLIHWPDTAPLTGKAGAGQATDRGLVSPTLKPLPGQPRGSEPPGTPRIDRPLPRVQALESAQTAPEEVHFLSSSPQSPATPLPPGVDNERGLKS